MDNNFSKYTKIRLIGEGTFGKAWLVRSHRSGRFYVTKEINLKGMKRQEKLQAANEVAILSRLKHNNVIRYREAFTSAGLLHIVMEYADQGDLAQRIDHRRRNRGIGFSEEQVLDWTVQICFALSYIHEQKILHRDLKPANIFLASTNLLKVGDFGIAKTLTNTLDQARTAIGTPYYLSPEICRRKPYNQKSDVWAVGCILYELVTLHHPFEAKDFSSLVMNILRGQYQSIPRQVSLSLFQYSFYHIRR
ncbi:Serine/threonine-protein kinase Nek1 [Holothuria leucospilota]|uniref:non-specific serine/threonine protein kinase n=1 Tax=Holothuria leucospilota TaxID=206669 RepID=A0A9Q0YBV7_HOLLE|nr:Serine/threonine-protein kinase Nek1 [Holothuria leucospilota]